MTLTEEEAKMKWCQETRIHVVADVGVYANKPITDGNPHAHANSDSMNCIGSACMAWRWAYGPDEAKGNKNGPLGYCGKAGKP